MGQSEVPPTITTPVGATSREVYYRAPKGGGPEVILATGLGGAAGLVASADHVLVTTYDAGTVLRTAK